VPGCESRSLSDSRSKMRARAANVSSTFGRRRGPASLRSPATGSVSRPPQNPGTATPVPPSVPSRRATPQAPDRSRVTPAPPVRPVPRPSCAFTAWMPHPRRTSERHGWDIHAVSRRGRQAAGGDLPGDGRPAGKRSLVRPVARTRSSRTASRVPATRGPRGRAPGRASPGPRAPRNGRPRRGGPGSRRSAGRCRRSR